MVDELDQQPPGTSGQVSYVGVKAPPFWKTNPNLWFIRLEAQFSLAKVTCETTKFNHVVAAVDADILALVSDLVMNPPTERPYEALKKRLIESHSESEESRLRTLLQGVELGDWRPSQLLTHMRSLAGSTVGETLLKSLWLSRLPTTTRSIVGVSNDQLPELAAMADKINDLRVFPQINAAATATSTLTTSLEIKVAQLTQQISELSAKFDERERSRSLSRSQSRNRQRSQSRGRYKEPANGMCFYHINFGARTKKCNQPCTFQGWLVGWLA